MANWKLVIEKRWSEPTGEGWNNTWEIGGSGATSMGAILPVVNSIIAFERSIHLTYVLFTRARVGSYQPTVDGYDPYRFWNIPVGAYGQRVAGAAQPTDLELVWKVNRVPATGNNGIINFRGVLTEPDTNASFAGRPRLAPNTQVDVDQAFITNMNQNLAPYLGTAPNIFIAMMGEYRVGGTPQDPIYGPTVVRRVTRFSVWGAGRLKLDKKSYERRGVDQGDGPAGLQQGQSRGTDYVSTEGEAFEVENFDWDWKKPTDPDPIIP